MTETTQTTQDTQRARQQIVQAAIGLFLKRGVPETSIDDIVAESGLPADVVLSQFARRNDVLRAIGAVNKASAEGMLKELLQEAPVATPAEMLGRSAAYFSQGGDPMRIVPQAWGVALYDDEINGVMRDVLMSLQDLWVELAGRLADEGRLPDGADREDVGRTLGCMIVGYMVQSQLSDVNPEHLRRGLQALVP